MLLNAFCCCRYPLAEVRERPALAASRPAVSSEKSARRYSRAEPSLFRCDLVVRVSEVTRTFRWRHVAQKAAGGRRNVLRPEVVVIRTDSALYRVVRLRVFGVRQSGHYVYTHPHGVLSIHRIPRYTGLGLWLGLRLRN